MDIDFFVHLSLHLLVVLVGQVPRRGMIPGSEGMTVGNAPGLCGTASVSDL